MLTFSLPSLESVVEKTNHTESESADVGSVRGNHVNGPDRLRSRSTEEHLPRESKGLPLGLRIYEGKIFQILDEDLYIKFLTLVGGRLGSCSKELLPRLCPAGSSFLLRDKIAGMATFSMSRRFSSLLISI